MIQKKGKKQLKENAGGGACGSSGSGDLGFILGSKIDKSKMGGPSEVSDARLLKKAKTRRIKDFKSFKP